jgi:multiple sugar transport system permease protein
MGDARDRAARVWKNFGYNMLIFVAGCRAFPASLYEAAELDGAEAWQRFRHITLPSLGPTFVFVRHHDDAQLLPAFAEPYVMTQGGPLKSTTTARALPVRGGFRWWRMGNRRRDRVRAVRDHARRDDRAVWLQRERAR